METFAKRLEKLRSEKNLTRAELAAALSLSKNAIEKMESGSLTPGRDQQARIAAYFGVTVGYLRGESDESWLGGHFSPEEESVKPAPVQRRSVQRVVAESKDEERGNSAVFELLLKSDAFRDAVLEILRSPEGQKLMERAAEKKLRGY